MISARARSADAIATITFAHGARRTLRAYTPEPAAQLRQADQISRQLYGRPGETLSPRTPYMCVWRNPDDFGARLPGPPARILLAGIFGTDPWSPPATLVGEAEARGRRDEAIVRVEWERDGGEYRMTVFDVELRGPGLRAFRSMNAAAELADVRVDRVDIGVPAEGGAPLPFHIGAAMPHRYNRGDPAGAPIVSVETSGTAVPMPGWLLY